MSLVVLACIEGIASDELKFSTGFTSMHVLPVIQHRPEIWMLHGCCPVSPFVAVAIPPQNVGSLYFTPGGLGSARECAKRRQ